MKRNKWNTGIRAYLEANRVDWNSPERIAELKRQYWALKKREYKANLRKTHIEVTVFFTEKEITQVDDQAKVFGLSRPKYLKQAGLHKFMTVDIGIVKMLLARNYNALLELLLSGKVSSRQINETLLRFENLEKELLSQLSEPKTLVSDN